MAIEALVNCHEDNGPRCKECNAPESIEKCTVCGLPRYRVTSRFKNFLIKFCSGLPNKFANTLYQVRSKLAHGGLLRDDLHDSGFYAGDKDEEQSFRRETRIVIRKVLLNWLIRSK